MEASKELSKPTGKDVGTLVINKIGDLVSNTGLTMPEGYNYVNAIKASALALHGMSDKDGHPILEVCTTSSIQNALFEMVTKGLDVSKKQAYFIKRGNKLTLQESYFGKLLQLRRIYPKFELTPRVIYEGDEFRYSTDISTGRKFLVKHEQRLENTDNNFVGAYVYLPCSDGGRNLYLMTRKQILAAWSKSSDARHSVHNQFTEKMVIKTIVSSACGMIINSDTRLMNYSVNPNEGTPEAVEVGECSNCDEVIDIDAADDDTAVIVEEEPISEDNSEIASDETAKDDVDF